MTTDDLAEIFADTRIRFWRCPITEHRNRRDSNGWPVQEVEWVGDVAHCLYPGCGRNSANAGRGRVVTDMCEWWPSANQPATTTPGQQCTNTATLHVGGGADNWRLCDTCAALPRFARKTRRIPINTMETR